MAASLVAMALTVPAAASAQTVSGLYLGLGVGANFLESQSVRDTILNGASTPSFIGWASFDAGLAGLASVGWGFGNGLRVELEGNFRSNSLRRYPGAAFSGGDEQKYGAMGNVLYDIDLGWPVTPYVGVGIGEQTTDWRNGSASGPGYFIRLQHPDVNVAYQVIVGAAVRLPVRGLALTAEYRFVGIEGGHPVYGQYLAGADVARPAEARVGSDHNHSLMVGIRYAFNASASGPPMIAAPASPAPQHEAVRTYLVSYDWDHAELTDHARQVIAEAAAATARVQVTRIEVSGQAGRSGTPRRNQALSLRRASVVAAELVRDGVPRAEIAVQGIGANRPRVPAVAGVGEPQNRRVQIVLL